MSGRPVKQVRIAEAREAARRAREDRERRARRRRAMIPLIASVAVVIVVGVVLAVLAAQPRSASPDAAGPRNMASGGIVFTAADGAAQPMKTGRVPAGAAPSATTWPAGDDRVHIQTYIDWTCPACTSFEAEYSGRLLELVESGRATLEVFPIAILDHSYTTDYSSRAANVAACVADRAPERFLAVQAAMYAHQAEEGGPGLTTAELLSLVHGAGVRAGAVDTCVRGAAFAGWVAAQTDRVTRNEALRSARGFSTPTIVADGRVWDRRSGLEAFLGVAR